MLIDFDAPLIDPKGVPFSDNSTLTTAAYLALATNLPGDVTLPMEKRMQQHRLMRRIGMGGKQEVNAEEIAEIKDRICKTMPTTVLGAAVDILESAKVATLVPEQQQKAG